MVGIFYIVWGQGTAGFRYGAHATVTMGLGQFQRFYPVTLV